jgi:hypothetical protein
MSAPNLDWTRDVRAIRILASIAANPPRREARSKVYVLTRDDWSEYTGYRVAALDAIWGEYLRRADAIGTDAALDAYNAAPSVQDAVHAAVTAPAVAVAA